MNLVYSQRNRSAACRIPVYSPSPKAKRVEFRCPDPSSNPYLAFSAIVMAGLDGGIRHWAPPPPRPYRELLDTPPGAMRIRVGTRAPIGETHPEIADAVERAAKRGLRARTPQTITDANKLMPNIA